MVNGPSSLVSDWAFRVEVDEEHGFFTKAKLPAQQCKNIPLQIKVLHSKFKILCAEMYQFDVIKLSKYSFCREISPVTDILLSMALLDREDRCFDVEVVFHCCSWRKWSWFSTVLFSQGSGPCKGWRDKTEGPRDDSWGAKTKLCCTNMHSCFGLFSKLRFFCETFVSFSSVGRKMFFKRNHLRSLEGTCQFGTYKHLRKSPN